MTSAELFYTAREVASMFRLTPTALSSRRKRGMAPGSFAVKVGGKYLYPKHVIDHYLTDLAGSAEDGLAVDVPRAEDRSPDSANAPHDTH